MDSDAFILELLGGQQEVTHARQACEYSACTAEPGAPPAWSARQVPGADTTTTTDDLNGLDTWDFAVMRSEFGDLQAFDSAALISLYRPAADRRSVVGDDEDIDDYEQEEEEEIEAPRCRSDSGYSTSSVGVASGHHCHWGGWGCCSPALSSSCDSAPSPDASAATAGPAGPPVRRHTHHQTPQQPRRQRILSSRQAETGAKLPGVKKSRTRVSKSRQMQLWQFLYHVLPREGDSQEGSGPLRWESRHEGTFRIVNPTALADAWGAHRRRSNMTYEKMSRTLRYYYDRRLITKVAGKQHTYRFHYDQFPNL